MQSAFQNAERDYVPLGLHTDSQKDFPCPERNSLCGNFMLQTLRYTKTESVMHSISVDVRQRYCLALGHCRKCSAEGVEWKSIVSAVMLM